MERVLPILFVLVALAVLATLGYGIFTMGRGGDPRRSNKIMQYRVILQGVALLIFFIFMMLYRRH